MRGIAAIKPGATLGDIGHAIQAYAEAQRFSVVRDFCGHGLGRVFHDAPNVLHYRPTARCTGMVLQPGMFFTVEPMINAGDWQVKVLGDGWTAVTRDRSLSAQFEHSVGGHRRRARDLHRLAGRTYTVRPIRPKPGPCLASPRTGGAMAGEISDAQAAPPDDAAGRRAPRTSAEAARAFPAESKARR